MTWTKRIPENPDVPEEIVPLPNHDTLNVASGFTVHLLNRDCHFGLLESKDQSWKNIEAGAPTR